MPPLKKKSTTLDSLACMVADGFSGVDGRFDKIEKRFDEVGGHFTRVENRLDVIEVELMDIKKKIDNIVYRHEFEYLRDRVGELEKLLKSKTTHHRK